MKTLRNSITPALQHSNTPILMSPSSLTCLAFLVNRVVDARPDRDLSFTETFDAASERRLISLLVERYGHMTNFTWITQRDTVNVEQIEAALCDAAAGFEGRVGRPTGPLSGVCLVMDIVLEAIQRQCSPAKSKITVQASEVALGRPLLNSCRALLHFFASVSAKIART